jgi:hypothetical protein
MTVFPIDLKDGFSLMVFAWSANQHKQANKKKSADSLIGTSDIKTKTPSSNMVVRFCQKIANFFPLKISKLQQSGNTKIDLKI